MTTKQINSSASKIKSAPRSKFDRIMERVQTVVMYSGLTFFAFIALRLIFKF